MVESNAIQPGSAEVEAITLTVDSRQISRDAVLRASYWFTKDLNVEFPSSTSADSLIIVLRPKYTVPTLQVPRPIPFKELIAEFQNALIDAELRVRVQRETSAIRELILAKAFAEAGVLEDPPPGSFRDPVLSAGEKLHSINPAQNEPH